MLVPNPGFGPHCIREAVRRDRFFINFVCNAMEPVLAADPRGGVGPIAYGSETCHLVEPDRETGSDPTAEQW
jgi:hypothetical protein